MGSSDTKPVGLTQDVGYQIGVRRTLPVSLAEAWQFLTSDEGLAIWLGETAAIDFSKGAEYALADGTQGEVRVFAPESHLRITWQLPEWARASTIQLRVIANGDRTVIAFHQEHLPGSAERETRRAHFTAALDQLETVWAS